MDPEGIREIYYAECGVAEDYGVRRAFRSLTVPVRWKESFFYGVHLPLTLPLPKRLDISLQQYVALHAYDAVVLADIDPVVFDADDLLNLQAYVEGGGGLMILGGPHTLSDAQRNWGPIREVLPVNIPLAPDKKILLWNDFPVPVDRPPREVSSDASHPVTHGLSSGLGQIRNIQPIEAKTEATILALAGEQPLVVAGTCGRGRVMVVGAWPDADRDCMFRMPGWDDLLRQALLWLMKREQDLWITRSDIDRSSLAVDQPRTFTLIIDPSLCKSPEARVTISRADPGWLAAGREPQFGVEEAQHAEVSPQRVRFHFSASAPGLWRTRLEVRGEKSSNIRIADVLVRASLDLHLRSRHGGIVATPKGKLELELASARPVQGVLRILDFDGQEVLRLPDAATGPVDVTLPQLELGDYEAVFEAEGQEAHWRFCVTEPLRRVGFSFVANAGGPTEEHIRRWFDYFRKRGFDAFDTGTVSAPGRPSGEPAFNPCAYQQYLVQREGLELWGEYRRVTLLQTHAHYGAEGTKCTTPCVLDPEHAVQLRRLLESRFRDAAASPRMAGIEILDEPHLLRANVCHCRFCRDEFRRRHGYDLPTWDEAIEARDHRTRDYFEWVVDYAARAFRMGYEVWKSLGSGPKLYHVLCSIGSGSISARHAVAEDLPWSPHADFIEFDCYNYMYPLWRGSRQLMWNEFHYLMGHFRFLTLRNRQRLGFYIQVTDRDIPVRPCDPLRAPSETLYTAIAGGAKTFHLMAKYGFTNKQNCREEKFDVFAQDIRKVRKAAPLLDRAERPRSRIAMAFPFHDRLYRPPAHWLPEHHVGLGFYTSEHYPCDTTWPNHKGPINAAEMLFRAFGELDVIDQRALREDPLKDYSGFALTGVDYIAEEDARAILRFVERGGILLCDHVPSHNLDGKPTDLLQPLFTGQREHFYQEGTITRSTFRKGRTLLFSDDLNELYTSSVEQENILLRHRIKETVRDFFFSAGLRPHALSSNFEVEAGVLLTADTMVLVCINHAGDRQTSRIQLFAPPVPVVAVYDLVTMRPHPFRQVGETLEVEVNLGERDGLILGLYPAVPVQLAIRADRPRVRVGEPLAFTVELADAKGEPVRGDQVVELHVTDAKGEERRQFGGLRCATNGRLRIEEPLAVNARKGAWTLTAFDRFTTRQVRTTVQVEG
jgi:uncharacterized membrane protein